MKKVLIIGAASAIAQETARLMAKNSFEFYLSDINQAALPIISDDLRARGAKAVHYRELDILNFEGHQPLIEDAIQKLGGIDIALIAYGTLPDQSKTMASHIDTLRELNINAVSVIMISTIISNHFEEHGSGTLAVISSVAGDRGRQSNYIYGSAKGAVSIYLQGLRNRLNDKGIKVLTIKPGLVDTPMTAHLPKNFLFAKPEKIANDIFQAIERGKDVLYTPWFWRIVMFMVKHIPESIFKKLKL
jgi:short-subunit dehydrogenase